MEMAVDGRADVDRLSLAASAPEERPFFPSFGDEERLSFFLEPKSFGSADGWPASGRPAGGGAGALAREAADGLLLSCCSEGAERGAAEQTRASRRLKSHLRALLPWGWGGTCCRLARCCARTGGGRSAAAREKRAHRPHLACRAVRAQTQAHGLGHAEVAGRSWHWVRTQADRSLSTMGRGLTHLPPSLGCAGDGGTPDGGSAHRSSRSRHPS